MKVNFYKLLIVSLIELIKWYNNIVKLNKAELKIKTNKINTLL